MAQRRARAALERARPSAASARTRVEVAGGQRARAAARGLAVGAEADDDEPRVGHAREHERPGGGEQVDALGDDQLADERDEAVAPRGSSAPSARPAARRRRARRRRRAASAVAARRRRRVARAPRSPRRGLGARRAARNCSTSTPGGPSRVRAGSVGVVQRRPQALGRVARADEHRARAARAPRGRRAGSARGRGLTVYSSALPWTFTAYGTSSPSARARISRAHHEVVGQRDVGPRRARRPRARRATLRVDVARDLRVGAARRTAWRRTPS